MGNEVGSELGHRRDLPRPGTAAVLSFFIPGVGQIYNGAFLRGIFWVSIRQTGPPLPAATATHGEAALRGCGGRGSPHGLPGRGREEQHFLFRCAPRQAWEDIGQVVDGVDAEQGAGRAHRVGDGRALGTRM